MKSTKRQDEGRVWIHWFAALCITVFGAGCAAGTSPTSTTKTGSVPPRQLLVGGADHAAEASVEGSKEKAKDTTPAPENSPAPQGGGLQEGDTVKISFEVSTNLNTITKVQLDGSITLPLIGQVQALHKTAAELKAELVKSYGTFLKAEEISVDLAQANVSIYVSGAVLKPGRISMDRRLTVLDAIMEAGGFDQTKAKISRVTVLRVENGKQRTFTVDLQKALNGGASEVFYLKPFDTVHVPEKIFHL